MIFHSTRLRGKLLGLSLAEREMEVMTESSSHKSVLCNLRWGFHSSRPVTRQFAVVSRDGVRHRTNLFAKILSNFARPRLRIPGEVHVLAVQDKRIRDCS